MAHKLTMSRALLSFTAVSLASLPVTAQAAPRGTAECVVSLDAYRAMRAESAWVVVTDRLRRWADLGADWDGDGAVPPTAAMVAAACKCADLLRQDGVIGPKATLATDGEIAFEWESGEFYASLSFTEDGHVIAFLRETDATPPLRVDEPFSLEALSGFFERIGAAA